VYRAASCQGVTLLQTITVMKKIYIIAFSFIISFAVTAQPAFTTANFPSAGAIDTYAQTNAPSFYIFFESETGPNYTWDFSTNYFYSQPNYTYYYRVPNQGLYTNFPAGSNLEEGSNLLSVANLYEMVNDTLYQTRWGTTPQQGTNMNPKTQWLTFPLNYGDSIYVHSPQTNFSHNHSYKYDGYGTVQLPWGTYNNLMRIHYITRDSSTIGTVTYSEYHWYKPSGGMPVVRAVTTTIADSVSHIYTIYANKSMSSTDVKKVNPAENISVYPNPATETLFISLEEHTSRQLIITDLTGRKLISRSLNGVKNEISLETLSSGLYMLSLYDENGRIVAYDKITRQ
jgi:hypothetical protein